MEKNKKSIKKTTKRAVRVDPADIKHRRKKSGKLKKNQVRIDGR